MPYRLQVTKALVHRYIEAARREFEESKRKGRSYFQHLWVIIQKHAVFQKRKKKALRVTHTALNYLKIDYLFRVLWLRLVVKDMCW